MCSGSAAVVKEVKAAEHPLNELKKAVTALERNRQQFHHISDVRWLLAVSGLRFEGETLNSIFVPTG